MYHSSARPQCTPQTKRPPLTRRGRLHIRIKEIDRALVDRYGPRLPDDDEARDYFRPLIQHALLIGPERARDLVAKRMPEFEDELDGESGHWWGDDELGVYLDFTDADRTRLKTWTIGGCDFLRDSRIKRRRRKRRVADRARRAKAGARPQRQSAERARPWEAEGISRATYYRRKAEAERDTVETVSRPAILSPNAGAARAASLTAPAADTSPQKTFTPVAAKKVSRVEASPPAPAIATTRADKPQGARQWKAGDGPEPATTTARADRGIARETIDAAELAARKDHLRNRADWLAGQRKALAVQTGNRRCGEKPDISEETKRTRIDRDGRQKYELARARMQQQYQSSPTYQRRAAALAEAIRLGEIEGGVLQ